MPAHGHSFSATSSSDGYHQHNIAIGTTILGYTNSSAGGGGGLGAMYGGNNGFLASGNGAHTHSISGNTGVTGGSQAHNIVQPSRSATLVIKT